MGEISFQNSYFNFLTYFFILFQMQEQNQNIDVYEFVEIPSQPGYECNRIGQVRKVGSNVVKKSTANGKGYLQTTCNGHHCLVHRLVAETFIPNPNQLPEVDHINNNRSDNNYQNLRWVNRSQNNFNCRFGNEVDEIPREATRIYFIGVVISKIYFTTTNAFMLILNIK